jgi:hypothetical protein
LQAQEGAFQDEYTVFFKKCVGGGIKLAQYIGVVKQVRRILAVMAGFETDFIEVGQVCFPIVPYVH